MSPTVIVSRSPQSDRAAAWSTRCSFRQPRLFTLPGFHELREPWPLAEDQLSRPDGQCAGFRHTFIASSRRGKHVCRTRQCGVLGPRNPCPMSLKIGRISPCVLPQRKPDTSCQVAGGFRSPNPSVSTGLTCTAAQIPQTLRSSLTKIVRSYPGRRLSVTIPPTSSIHPVCSLGRTCAAPRRGVE